MSLKITEQSICLNNAHVFLLEWQTAFLKTGYSTLHTMYFRLQNTKNAKHESKHAFCWDIRTVCALLKKQRPQTNSQTFTDHWKVIWGTIEMGHLWHRWENPLILRSVVAKYGNFPKISDPSFNLNIEESSSFLNLSSRQRQLFWKGQIYWHWRSLFKNAGSE